MSEINREINKCQPNTPPAHVSFECQSHVHEFQGSVKYAEYGKEKHNHRFEGVTSEVIPICGGGHKHIFIVNSDYFDHHHEVCGETEPAIYVCEGKHVHYASGETTYDDNHTHAYQFATLIEAPLC